MMKIKKSKHYIKKILSFLTVVCCLAGNMASFSVQAGAVADDRTEVTAGANPRIVFTNEPTDEANLNVFKLVESADGSKVPAEETEKTEFTFRLELNGQPADKAIYHLYNGSVAEDKEVAAGGNNDKFRTKSDGTFFLKAGQIAVFRSEENPSVLSEGVSYTVTEESTNEKYALLKSENAQGSIGKNGARAIFTNEYIPQGKGTEARIDIVKTVLFPEGYAVPKTPDFTFQLKLNNQVCGGTAYEIIDNETGKKIDGGDGITDANGIFTLKGGCTARFTQDSQGEKFKSNVDYEVTELTLPEGWRAVGNNAISPDSVQNVTIGESLYNVAARMTGKTIAITRVHFSNISASFGASKYVEGSEKPDVDFTFELTHGDRSVWPGASYYLFNSAGNLIDAAGNPIPDYTQNRAKTESESSTENRDETESSTNGSETEAEPLVTDKDGRFTLKHGQTAIFYGIPAGEKYNIREVRQAAEKETVQNEESMENGNAAGGNSGTDGTVYVQSEPENPEGYTDKTVTDATPPVWVFKNKPADIGLTVTKAVTNTAGEAAFKDVEFHFTLYKRIEKTGGDEEIGEGEGAGESEDIGEVEGTGEGEESGKGRESTAGNEKQYDWEPVVHEWFQKYEGGTEAEDNKTDKNGSFTLKPYGTVVFPRLQSGYYKVVEDVSATPEYSAANPDKDAEGNTLSTQTMEGWYEAGSTLEFSFENIYGAWKFDLKMVKEDGEGNALQGAQFKLYWDAEQTNPVTADTEEQPDNNNSESADSVKEKELAGIFTTGEDGIVTIQNLKSGTYILEEAKAPSGYAILFEPIKLEVTRTENGIEVKLNDGKADSKIVEVTGRTISTSNENDSVEITVYNTRLYELPSSGGIGIYWYSIGGMLLMMAASLILYRKNIWGRC